MNHVIGRLTKIAIKAVKQSRNSGRYVSVSSSACEKLEEAKLSKILVIRGDISANVTIAIVRNTRNTTPACIRLVTSPLSLLNIFLLLLLYSVPEPEWSKY